MQTFPPLCIYNSGLPRRISSPRTLTPRDFSTPVRPPCHARPPSLPRASALQLPRVPAVPPAAVRARLPYVRGHGAGTEVDLPSWGPSLGGGRRWSEPNDDGDERGLGWAATDAKTWARRQLGRPGLGGD